MAWLIGLWIGDGTTVRPEISVDSLDTNLMNDLAELCKIWDIYPNYSDGAIPLRAKHVKLYYGKRPPNKKYYHNCKTNNPFWKAILDLKFKDEDDGSKQIPDFLWNDDIIIRETFLAGLIDADGYVGRNMSHSGNLQVNIQTIYPSVMKGIVNISRSLGINVTVTTKPERMAMIKGKVVHCKLTYDCALIGKTALQNILSYCHSGHKIRNRPKNIQRDPIYFTFDDEVRGLNHVYFIELENAKSLLLANKMSISTCNNNCSHEQKPYNREKNHKQCHACQHIGMRRYYRDWTGMNKLCSRCYARYKNSGYRCQSCNMVPDSREIKRKHNNQNQNSDQTEIFIKENLPCSNCEGTLTYDSVRGPIRNANRIRNM